MQNTSSTSQTNAHSSSSTQSDQQTREVAEILCSLGKRPADPPNPGPSKQAKVGEVGSKSSGAGSSSGSSASAKKLHKQNGPEKPSQSDSKRPAAPPNPGPSKQATKDSVSSAERSHSGSPQKQLTEIVKDILKSPNLDVLFDQLSSQDKDTVNFWDIFYTVIKQKLEKYLVKSRDNKPIKNIDDSYKLKKGNKEEFLSFMNKFNLILETTKFPPTKQTEFIDFILSQNTTPEITTFKKFCIRSQQGALERAKMENSCKETTDQVHNLKVQSAKLLSSQLNQFNFEIHTNSNFSSKRLNYLNQMIEFKKSNNFDTFHPIINFQYHATLFTGIRHLMRRCIKSVNEKLSKGAENNYDFRSEDYKKFVSDKIMSTLNKEEIIGKEIPNTQEFIKYILSEEFKTFIDSQYKGCGIVSEFQQINEELKNEKSPTEQYTKSLDFLTLDEFGGFLQSKRTNRFDEAPFVTEIWEQYSSLKQNIASHELYKNEEFKKFVLDQLQIDGNIYGPENQKKIVVTLLKNINNPDRNRQEKNKLLDSLKTYIKECDSVDLSNEQITDTDLKAIANLCPQLKSLDLTGCKKITNEVLGVIAKSCPQLKSINLTGCKKITNEVLGVIAKSCPQLKSINLTSCKKITDLSSLSKLNSLQSLDLFDCFNITDLSPLSKLKSLQSLNLSHCRQITNLSPLSELKNLNLLSLHGCKQIANLSPLSELISLQSLNLSDCLNIPDLSHLSKLKNLNSLSLYGCNQITNAGIEALGELTRLQSLYLNGCRQITDLSSLSKLNSLQSLDLSGCNQITDAGVSDLRTKLPKLMITK